jgi:Tol biopolymer transport system component
MIGEAIMSLHAFKHSNFLHLIALTALLLLMPVVLSAQEKIVFQSQRGSDTEIYVMNPDGTSQLPLTSSPYFDGEPALSPGGDKIAFSSYRDGNSEIYIMNTNGAGQTNLTNNPAFDGHPSFSPDGDRIVFASMRNNHFGIWVMNIDGSNPMELVEAFGGTDPSFSPDGTRIVFCGLGGGAATSEIWVMDANGLNRKNLSQDDNAEDLDPSFSPDGTQIVFTKKIHGVAFGEVMVMSADGTSLRNLTNNSLDDYSPSFSPSGSFITFTSTRDGNAEVYVMNADGTNPINMSRNPSIDERPVWGLVPNSPPVLNNISVWSAINEGQTATLSGEIVDLDATDSFTLDVSWGDGQSQSVNYPYATAFVLTHVYADDPPAGAPTDDYTITLTVNDHHSGIDSRSTSVTVNNVNPIIYDTTVSASPVAPGTPVSLLLNYTDPGYHGSPSDEDLRAFINWGDGQAVVVATGRPESVHLTHQYSAIGNYSIRIEVTDNDGGLSVEIRDVVVLGPPATPANFRVQSVGADSIQLAWTDASNNEDGFAIERCVNKNCTNFVEVARVGANVTAYLDSNLLSNTQYSYRMRSFNGVGLSAYTPVVSAKTLRR